jgi:hypothetical protein
MAPISSKYIAPYYSVRSLLRLFVAKEEMTSVEKEKKKGRNVLGN